MVLDLDRRVLRAYLPATTCWLVAAVSLAVLERLPGEPASDALGQGLRLVVVAALMAMLAQGGWVSWRLWQRRAPQG